MCKIKVLKRVAIKTTERKQIGNPLTHIFTLFPKTIVKNHDASNTSLFNHAQRNRLVNVDRLDTSLRDKLRCTSDASNS